MILGRIIEVVSGKPYDQYMAEKIFEPLRMNDTEFFVPGDKQSRVAAVYTEEGGSLKRAAGVEYQNGPRIPSRREGCSARPAICCVSTRCF